MQNDDRLYYMDNLRALAMLAGVLFHAALAYSPLIHNYWPTADAGGSVWVDVLAWFVHLFRMPLFFVISGFFAALLVRKRGMGGMLHNRLKRVLLPFVIFLPLVYRTLMWLTAEAASTTQNVSPALAWVKQVMREQGSLPLAPTVTTVDTLAAALTDAERAPPEGPWHLTANDSLLTALCGPEMGACQSARLDLTLTQETP